MKAEYKTYDVKSNSFSKWKAGAWALDIADEIGLAVVDLQELPRVADVLSEQKWIPYFYSVLGLWRSGEAYFLQR